MAAAYEMCRWLDQGQMGDFSLSGQGDTMRKQRVVWYRVCDEWNL